MKKVITSVVLTLCLGSSGFAERVPSGIELAMTQMDFGNFWKEFSISGKIVTCGTKDPKKNLLGFEATMSEALYVGDATRFNNKVASLGMNFGTKRADKSGTMRGDGGIYVNLIRFPLLGMILGEADSYKMFAFEKGSPRPVYLGGTDFKKWDNLVASDLMFERTPFMNLPGAIAGVVSCTATTMLDSLSPSSKRNSSVAKQLRNTMDSYFYVTGCLGPTTVGTSSKHANPIANAYDGLASVLNDLHTNLGVVGDFSVKHRVKSILNGHSNKLMCSGLKVPTIVMSQYTTQLLYPTVGKTKELGVTPIEYSFKLKGTKADNTVIFLVNQRKDYGAFVYGD